MPQTANASYVQAFPNYRIRQTAQANQPRYVVVKRLNSVRLNWFMLGSLAGMAVCFAFNMLVGAFLGAGGERLPQLAQEKASFTLESIASTAEAPTSTPQPQSAAEKLEKVAKTQPEAPAAELASTTINHDSYPKTVTHALKKGETLANILMDHGIGNSQAHNAIASLRKGFDPRDLRVGQKLALTLDKDASDTVLLSKLEIRKNTTESVVLARGAKGAFAIKNAKKTLQPKLTLAGGTITSSLFETGYANGIPNGVLAELMQAYSYDVDFQREIKRGDQIEVLFERMITEDGQRAGYGDILYATLKLRGKPNSIYRYETSKGRTGFYNEKGESVVKALLKTPINGARMSSGYGMRRHPILGYNKMHKGTDFAAPTGTPIYAAGEGTVQFVGRKGGYGNYIKIKHNGTYATAYAHLHRFAKGMRRGKAVKQGQVIGYVGSTGRSTGPHLHYEVHKNGKQVNPMGERFQTGQALKGKELARFKKQMTKIKQQVASMPRNKTTVASAQ